MSFQRTTSRWNMRPLAMALATVAATCAMSFASPGSAGDRTVGAIEITQVWSRATPAGAKVGAGYLKIKNTGSAPDRLVGGTAAIAGRVEIHEMKMVGGVMKMRKLADGLEIAPGATRHLKPGGYHIMFMQLKKPIVEGRPFKATLNFAKAGSVELAFKVEKIGAASSSGGDGGSHKGHMSGKSN